MSEATHLFSSQQPAEEEEDTDTILAELEAEDDPDTSRLQQQRRRDLQHQSGAFSSGSGLSTGNRQNSAYSILKSDDETLQFTTEHEKAVVHFFHPDFARCSIMDEHLTRIAQTHETHTQDQTDIKFARVDVSHAAFVVQKLSIQVLPCVIGFEKGVIKGRVVGFEGLCWDGREKDARVTRALENQLVEWGMLRKPLVNEDEIESENEGMGDDNRDGGARRGIKGRKQEVVDEDDDWD